MNTLQAHRKKSRFEAAHRNQLLGPGTLLDCIKELCGLGNQRLVDVD